MRDVSTLISNNSLLPKNHLTPPHPLNIMKISWPRPGFACLAQHLMVFLYIMVGLLLAVPTSRSSSHISLCPLSSCLTPAMSWVFCAGTVRSEHSWMLEKLSLFFHREGSWLGTRFSETWSGILIISWLVAWPTSWRKGRDWWRRFHCS